MLTRELGVFTAYFCSRPVPEPSTQRATLEGPTLVLAEAERRECTIARVYISRHTAPELVRRLENTLRKGIPVVETSAAELTLLAGCRPHSGVVALLGRPVQRRSLTERTLWYFLRLALHESVQTPSRS